MTSEELKLAYMRLFNTPDGEAILKDLESRCYRYKPTYQGDVAQGHINEGKRQMLSHVETMLLPIEREKEESDD